MQLSAVHKTHKLRRYLPKYPREVYTTYQAMFALSGISPSFLRRARIANRLLLGVATTPSSHTSGSGAHVGPY